LLIFSYFNIKNKIKSPALLCYRRTASHVCNDRSQLKNNIGLTDMGRKTKSISRFKFNLFFFKTHLFNCLPLWNKKSKTKH